MKAQILFLLLNIGFSIFAQNSISGFVFNENKEPLVGANIYIKGSYDGTSTDSLGYFKLETEVQDSSVLIVSYLGYQPYEKLLDNTISFKQEIILEESLGELNEVVITAGTFEADEKNRAVLLNPIEVATTASSDGDVYGALATFPGVQKQGETGKIIVRGGESHESKTYMDGMLVSSPYTSSMPDLPARGRFAPFIFNGVIFSTGGYSAEYGQALSSVLELKTPGIFDEDITSVSLMNVGGGLGITRRNSRSAYSAEANYYNLYPYFIMAKHDLKWIKVPESFGGNLYHRIKIGKTGMIKTDITYSNGTSILDYSNFSNEYKRIKMNNSNLFYKTTYNTELKKDWILKIGYAFNSDNDIKDIDTNNLTEQLVTHHLKACLINYTTDKLTLKTGAELYRLHYNFEYFDFYQDQKYFLNVNDNLYAGYIEGDIKVSKKIAARFGLRSEYSSLTGNKNFTPRTSLAFKTTKNSQFSLAWGRYFQQVDHKYMIYNSNLDFENAEHYIVNYQVQKNKRIFRIEGYYKKYKNLISYTRSEQYVYENIGNQGYGYARGLDLFWKDNKTFRFGHYWLSYSYIDSKRNFRDYENLVTPDFITSHNFSVVMKYWINALKIQTSLTYNFSSGRPFNNPNSSVFMDAKTKSWHDISGNLSYVTNIFSHFTVVHLSVSNIPGLENIYTYRYSEYPDENGLYKASPVKSMMYRTVILGMFISIK